MIAIGVQRIDVMSLLPSFRKINRRQIRSQNESAVYAWEEFESAVNHSSRVLLADRTPSSCRETTRCDGSGMTQDIGEESWANIYENGPLEISGTSQWANPQWWMIFVENVLHVMAVVDLPIPAINVHVATSPTIAVRNARGSTGRRNIEKTVKTSTGCGVELSRLVQFPWKVPKQIAPFVFAKLSWILLS